MFTKSNPTYETEAYKKGPIIFIKTSEYGTRKMKQTHEFTIRPLLRSINDPMTRLKKLPTEKGGGAGNATEAG